MRGLKYLFAVPKGEKVTEKHFRRILLTSVCSILLSMACLVSTTWAWFSVTVEGKGQMYVAALKPVIRVGESTDVRLSIDTAGTYEVVLDCSNPGASADAFDRKASRYVVFTVQYTQNGSTEETKGYVILNEGNHYTVTITNFIVHDGVSAELSVAASWVVPSSLALLNTDSIQIGTESTEPPTEPSESTGPSETPEPSESTGPSETPEPSESTEPSETTISSETTVPAETTEPSESVDPSETTDPSDGE